MIKAFKRWLAKAAYEGLQQPEADARINKLHDMFSHQMSALVAFKIDNGYVVRVMDPDAIQKGEVVPGFTYCADHKAIADYIVSSAMRERIGIPSRGAVVQRELFAKTKTFSQPHGY